MTIPVWGFIIATFLTFGLGVMLGMLFGFEVGMKESTRIHRKTLNAALKTQSTEVQLKVLTAIAAQDKVH